jgi:hypothetical protein
MMKNLKKMGKVLLVLMLAAWVLTKPGPAANTLRSAGQSAYQGVLGLANGAAQFLDALFRH